MTSAAGKMPESGTERFSSLTAALTSVRWVVLGALACELRVAPSVIERWGQAHAPESGLRGWLEDCVARGLLVDAGIVHVPSMLGGPHDERALVINREFRALTLRELARKGALDDVRQAGRALLGERSVASFVTALYSGELATVERTLAQLRFRFPRGEEAAFARRMLWQSIALPFDADWLSRIWKDSALAVAEQVLLDALLTLEPVSDLYVWALTHVRRGVAQEGALEILPVLAMHALLRGEAEVVRELAVRLPTHEQLAWNAVRSLMLGELPRAQRLLDESQAWNKQKRLTARFDAAPAPVLALLAVSRNTAEGLALAKRLVRAGKPSDTAFVSGWSSAPSFAASGRATRRLIQHVTAPEAERARLDVHQLPSEVAAWELLILGLAAHVHRTSPITRAAWARRLSKASEAWGFAGYAWFSRQARSLADALSPEKAEETQEPPLPLREFSLADLIEPPPEWRESLKALATFADEAETGRVVARRIAWFIDMTRGELAKPALEEFVKDAGWSRGPRVEITELLPYLESLPSEDVEVLRRAMATGAGPSVSEALEALCGHPRVFNGARGRLPVQVVRGICRVETRRERGQLVVRIEPEGAVLGINTVVQGEARVLVYRVSAAVAKLTSLIPKSLVIPEAHAEEANVVLSRLAEHVEIHNEHLEAQRTVPAENTPCLRLSTEAGAFSLELGVRPFGTRGRFFPPGLGPTSVTTHDAGELLETERDFAAEQRRIDCLITSIPTLQAKSAEQAEEGGSSPYSFTLSEEELYGLLVELDESGSTCAMEWRNGRPVAARGTVKRSSVRGALRRTKGWYIVTGGVRIDDVTEIALSELVRMPFTRTGRFIRLPTGDFLEVERQLRRVLSALASNRESEGRSSKAEIRIPDAAFGALGPLHSADSGIEIDASASQWASNVQSVLATNFPLPEGLSATLRSYQLEGYQWLRRSSELGLGVVLADDMGLGKTLQVLALLLARASAGPAIVVAPTSVCTNWIDEIARFAPTLSALEYTGKGRDELLDGLRETAGSASKPPDVIVVSYALLQQDADALASIEWNTAVLDEAQFIKNESSLRAKAAFRLRAAYRVAMTGTPVENHLGDLWSLFHFLNEPLLGSAKHFEVRYRLPIERDKNSERQEALKRLIGPFILRRTKDQVLRELPRITTLRHEVRLSRDEAVRYALLRRQIHEKLHTATGKREHKLQVFSEITRLRRFCCHPRLVFPEAPSESSKVQTFLELAEELRDNGHRALVFSQFVDFLDLVREQLDERGMDYLYLDGGTPKAARHERVGAFQAGDATLFLISLKAGGFGLNLTAADYVIHLDPWWNPAVEAQATDRAHRIGQNRPVTVYRLITKDTIEERIVELHREKRALATALLDGTDMAARLTAEDLLSLLEDRG